LGVCMVPMLPVIIENAIECTYPASEELSTGLLFTAGNVIGIPITFLMQCLIDQQKDWTGSPWGRPVNLLIVGTGSLCSFVAFFYNGPYLRLETEKRLKEEGEREQGRKVEGVV